MVVVVPHLCHQQSRHDLLHLQEDSRRARRGRQQGQKKVIIVTGAAWNYYQYHIVPFIVRQRGKCNDFYHRRTLVMTMKLMNNSSIFVNNQGRNLLQVMIHSFRGCGKGDTANRKMLKIVPNLPRAKEKEGTSLSAKKRFLRVTKNVIFHLHHPVNPALRAVVAEKLQLQQIRNKNEPLTALLMVLNIQDRDLSGIFSLIHDHIHDLFDEMMITMEKKTLTTRDNHHHQA